MSTEIVQFAWQVHELGYRLAYAQLMSEAIGGVERSETVLVPVDELNSRVWRYHPLVEHSGLFRTFAQTETTVEGVAAFVEKHGQIAPEYCFVEKTGTWGDRVDYARSEMAAMRRALDLWDMLERGDEKGLSSHFEWKERGVLYSSHPGLDAMTPPEVPEGHFAQREYTLIDRGDPKNVREAALFYIRETVNKHMRASAKLLWNPRSAHMEVHLVPANLLGAIWLQFARAVDGYKKYQRCGECGTWFEVSPEISRTDKTYCSNRCRSKAYRGRIVTAKRLYSEGRTIDEIASEIGSDAETVRGWIDTGASRSKRTEGD